MPTARSRALLLGATLVAVAGQPALAQPPPCAERIAQLDQRIEALRGGGLAPEATRAELEGLRAYRQAAEQAMRASRAQACATLVEQALGTVMMIERPRVASASRMEDAKLRSPDGKDLGTIDELIVDPGSGQIAYAVVELGGFLGMGERYFPVPWSLVEPAPEGEAFVLGVPRERLTAAPQFARDNRPNMSDRQWALAVHTYYGVEPYWLRDGAALAAAAQGQAAQGQGAAPAAGSSAPAGTPPTGSGQ